HAHGGTRLHDRGLRRHRSGRSLRCFPEQICAGPRRINDRFDGGRIMSTTQDPVDSIPNGSGGAAILAAGIGCATIGILALAGDASDGINKALNFYRPAGALSGVTTIGIIVWLVAWFALDRLWREKTVAMVTINVWSFVLLAVGFLLTFPP